MELVLYMKYDYGSNNECLTPLSRKIKSIMYEVQD